MDDESFWSKVDARGPCWEWRTAESGHYGEAPRAYRGISRLAHRVSYTILVGPIPVGLVLDHICRNPRCVNPDHLEPVTQGTNFRRGYHRSAVAHRGGVCVAGHLMTPENTMVRGRKKTCRECNRQWQREYRQKNLERVRAYDRARNRRRRNG